MTQEVLFSYINVEYWVVEVSHGKDSLAVQPHYKKPVVVTSDSRVKFKDSWF